ncbi:MAG: hypothetical protein WKF84_20430 [Pyrinomonadaceae bacterium]
METAPAVQAPATVAVAATAGGSAGVETAPQVAIDKDALRTELAQLNAELDEVQGQTPLMQACVNSQTIAEVISGWTGIPVGKMLTDEINAVLGSA